MHRDGTKKIKISIMVFSLVAAVFFPLVNSQVETLVTSSAQHSLQWWDPEWLYRKELTINHTKVAADLVDFPLLVMTTLNTSKVQHDGNDIVFTDSLGIKLHHEIESYNNATGVVYAWVNVTRLSSTTNTKLWMYYGNAGCGSQQNKYGTWNAKYKAVYHLDESGPPYFDSTMNQNNIMTANVNGTGMAQSGGIYTWQHFNGTSNRFVLPFSLSGAYTLEAIASTDSVALSGVLLGYGLTTSSPSPGVAVGISPTNNALLIGNSNSPKALSPITQYVTNKTTHWWSDVYKSNTSLRFYLDGTNVTSSLSNVNYFNNANGYYTIGARYTSGSYSMFWKGCIDEVRISNGTWNASWIKTCFTNQKNPESFYSLGTEQIQLPNPPPCTGPSWGLKYVTYTFSVMATNPNGDNLYCIWEWGDGNSSGWLGPYSSGETISASYSWSHKGTYGIRIKLKDIYGQETKWSPPHAITIYEVKKGIIVGRFADKSIDGVFITIHAVNLRIIFFKPFQFVHDVSGENITFMNNYRSIITRRFIMGSFDVVM